MKQCYRCKEIKFFNEFNKNKASKDGYEYVCRECSKKRKKVQYYYDIELSRSIRRNYVAKNRIKECLRVKIWYQNNKSKKQEYDKNYAKENIDKRRLASKKFRDNHPNRKKADTAYRRAWRIKATPKWADLKSIKIFYENCPNNYHVDHIIPLKGKNVSGLHVLNNLQYLTAKENLSKSNHYSSYE